MPGKGFGVAAAFRLRIAPPRPAFSRWPPPKTAATPQRPCRARAPALRQRCGVAGPRGRGALPPALPQRRIPCGARAAAGRCGVAAGFRPPARASARPRPPPRRTPRPKPGPRGRATAAERGWSSRPGDRPAADPRGPQSVPPRAPGAPPSPAAVASRPSVLVVSTAAFWSSAECVESAEKRLGEVHRKQPLKRPGCMLST